MKTSFNILFSLTITALLVTTSCHKTIDADIQNAVQEKIQTNDLFKCDNCLITHYEDDYLFFTYDVSYNNRKEPDSVHITSMDLDEAATYDKLGRLSKITFPHSTVQDYETFQYERSLLPSKLLYIVPNYKDYGQTDSINEVISFKYNYRGEMIQMKFTNVWYTGYDITYNYEYDNNGNVKSITHIPQTGTTYTEYVFTSYDDKPNFMTGSIWLRYMLLNAGFDPFYQLLLSRNNAKDWAWNNAFQTQGENESFTSTFNYNNKGFANAVNMNVTDNVYGNFTFTRNAVSSCDNSSVISKHTSPSAKSFIPLHTFKRFNQQLPFFLYKKEK